MTKQIISEILQELYPSFKKDAFYSIPDVKECDVRKEISSKMRERGIKNMSYLDLYVFTTGLNNGVLLKELNDN